MQQQSSSFFPNTLLDVFFTFSCFGEQPAFIYRSGYRRFVTSYRTLSEKSLRLAAWLQNKGLQRGDAVLLWGPNSPEWAIAFWGTLLAGGVVVPIDMLARVETALHIARKTKVAFLFSSHAKPDLNIPSLSRNSLEHIDFLIAGTHPITSFPNIQPGDIAEIIFTSGTTGNPKGVVMRHRNLCANIRQISLHISIKPNWVFLSVLPVSHLFEQTGGFLVPLFHGCSIVYLRAIKPTALREALRAEHPHILMIVPRLLQALKSSIASSLSRAPASLFFSLLTAAAHTLQASPEVRKKIFFPIHRVFGKRFQFFVSGGAALDKPLEAWWEQMGFVILQGYGLTECAPVLTANQPHWRKIGTVGTPVPDVHITLASDGEILARGPNIFDTYFKDTDATRNAFTPDGWFKTGDIGAKDDSGFLVIRGRKKDVIVTDAGVNIYPEDIETVLARIPGVRESAVIEYHARPFAILVLEPNVSGETVIKQANRRLSSAEMIAGWKIWDDAELPKTSTLKVKKDVLRKHVRKDSSPNTHSPVAGKLAHLISRATGAAPSAVVPSARLVEDLGLTSVGRLELAALLEQEFLMDIREEDITPATIVRDIERMVQKREKKQAVRPFRTWQYGRVVGFWRNTALSLAIRPLIRFFCRPSAVGTKNFSSLQTPVLFAANHTSHFDQPCILTTLPSPWNVRTLAAARSEFFTQWRSFPERIFKNICFYFCTLFLNVFPLSQTSAFRSSIIHAGIMIDEGFSVLIFPEGERTQTGHLLPFKPGVALLARELRIPVIPVKIDGIDRVLPRGAHFPKRNSVTVHYGQPLTILPDESTQQFLNRLANAIQKLPSHETFS